MNPLPTMREWQDQLIQAALVIHCGNITEAAKAIDVSRNTIYRTQARKAACAPESSVA